MHKRQRLWSLRRGLVAVLVLGLPSKVYPSPAPPPGASGPELSSASPGTPETSLGTAAGCSFVSRVMEVFLSLEPTLHPSDRLARLLALSVEEALAGHTERRRAILEIADAWVPCLEEPVPPGMLAELLVRDASARFRINDPLLERSLDRGIAVLGPGANLTGEDPKLRLAFTRRLQGLELTYRRLEPGTLSFPVWVDGTPLGSGREFITGRHLLQTRLPPAGRLEGRWIEVPPGPEPLELSAVLTPAAPVPDGQASRPQPPPVLPRRHLGLAAGPSVLAVAGRWTSFAASSPALGYGLKSTLRLDGLALEARAAFFPHRLDPPADGDCTGSDSELGPQAGLDEEAAARCGAPPLVLGLEVGWPLPFAPRWTLFPSVGPAVTWFTDLVIEGDPTPVWEGALLGVTGGLQLEHQVAGPLRAGLDLHTGAWAIAREQTYAAGFPFSASIFLGTQWGGPAHPAQAERPLQEDRDEP